MNCMFNLKKLLSWIILTNKVLRLRNQQGKTSDLNKIWSLIYNNVLDDFAKT